MTEKKTGGPAFPNWYVKPDTGEMVWFDSGMTLRDYFAAKAMAAFIQATVHIEPSELANAVSKQGHEDAFGLTAEFAYKQADAMLKAREA